MTLLLLLLVPLLIGVTGILIGRGKITVKEFAIQEAAILLVIGIGYAIALSSRSSDTEHWNGQIAAKIQKNTGCCHPYCCAYTTVCTSSGKTTSCHQVCTAWCHYHPYDVFWGATTTNGEEAYSNSCNSPSTRIPDRWAAIKLGEPTSMEHSFTNYIKGNPDSILRRTGAVARWPGNIPAYPVTYDLYRANKVIPVGLKIPGLAEMNEAIAILNGEIGAKKQVNVILVVVASADASYAEALREAWLGGKKNDVTVVIGTPAFPQIAWASVMSWSEREDMKVTIRDRIVELGTFGPAVVDVLRDEVNKKYVRKRWEDFNYLKSTIEPSSGVQWFLWIFGVSLSIGLAILFYRIEFENEGEGEWKIPRLSNWRWPASWRWW